MTYTEQLQQKFFSLPKSLQDAVRSEENNTFLENLAKKYMLNSDQQMDLVHTSAYVLLGEISRADFGKRIALIDGVGEAAAQAIARTIDEKLFAPLAKEIEDALQNRIPTGAIESDLENEQVNEVKQTPQEKSEFVPPKAPSQQKWRMPRQETPVPTQSAPVVKKEEPEETIAISTPPPQSTPTPQEQGDSEPTPTKTVASDEPATPDVITIPTITITKPPRFIPLKDLKQGSIKARPAPQGVPSRDTMPSFPSTPPRTDPSTKLETNSSTELGVNSSTQTPKNNIPPASTIPTPSVLPRIEPTPEKLASTVITPQPQTPKPAPSPMAIPRTPSNDPYHEPIDTP